MSKSKFQFVLLNIFFFFHLPAVHALPNLTALGRLDSQSQVQEVNVFQGETRKEIKNPKDGWRAVGLLYSPLSGGQSVACTASLVGPDLILTSGSCITERGHNHPSEIQFFLQYNTRNKKNPMPYHARVRKIWMGTNEKISSSNLHKHWAILRLDSRLGDTVGWLGVIRLDPVKLVRLPPSQPLHMAGYSFDVGQGTVPLLEKGCEIKGFAVNPVYYHNCSGIHFSQGSPLVILLEGSKINGGAAIVAMHTTSLIVDSQKPGAKIRYDLDSTNIAIGVDDLIPKLKELRSILD